MRIERTAVIAAALDLLDEAGLEGLTMRKLADMLHIQAPSLYWHFKDKRELVDAMADALLADVAVGAGSAADWRENLTSLANQVRRALLSRREGARVFAGTYPISENVLRVGDAAIGCLVGAGVEPKVAVQAAFTLLYFVFGFVIEEQAHASGAINLIGAQLDGAAGADLMARYPSAALAFQTITPQTADERFAFGMELQLAGLETLIG